MSVGQLEVHERGDTFADVAEGLFRGVFWERCRYEWSQPSAVTATVLDSNILQPGSSWEITATPADGGTHVEATFVRDYKGGLKGRFAKTLFRVCRQLAGGSDLRRALAKIEAGESPR